MEEKSSLTTEEIVKEALRIGFSDCAVTKAEIPEADIAAYEAWLAAGNQADLAYMENRIRTKPTELFPGAESAILFVTYYKQPKISPLEQKGIIASYARGLDYHNIHRKRIKKFIAFLEERSGQKGIAKGFSDSVPIMERALAAQAGLGFFGKNSLLIHRKFGTFFLLSGVLTTLKLFQTVKKDRLPRCGSCTKCLDSCPTGALTPYTLNASKCLSYHLIESKKPIPEEIQKKNPGYLFGCDICQDVCPHNVRKELSEDPDFASDRGLGAFLDLSQLEEIEKEPTKLFGTPLKRRGAEGLKYSLSTLNA